mgnify:CR=1 FL=1
MKKKMDEMDRQILLLAEERGYRVILLALCAWTLYNCWQVLAQGGTHNPLPSLILCLGLSVQSFSQLAMGQKMVEGDTEYQGPNKLRRTIILTVVMVTIILSAGVYLVVRQ